METMEFKLREHMPDLCKFRNCHNLGSRIFEGYCSDSHQEKAHQDSLINARMLAEHRKQEETKVKTKVSVQVPSKESVSTPPGTKS